MSELWPYLVLIVVGFLPNEVWRVLGLVLSRGIEEDSDLLLWVRAVAIAILAGVVAQLILFSPGALATLPLWLRLGAVLTGFVAFLCVRRSVFVGVLTGETVLLLGAGAIMP